MVDEAAMLDSRVTGELLAEARRSGAKVILAGDDRQLASIERGGLFSELRQRHGSAEISEITRQRADWQRHRRARSGRGAVRGCRGGVRPGRGDHLDAGPRGCAGPPWSRAWKRDTATEPDATRFVFAYTNVDVDALNAELRQVRRDRGELARSGRAVRDEARAGGFCAGRPGAVHRHAEGRRASTTAMSAPSPASTHETGVIRARLDATAAGQGREVDVVGVGVRRVPARLCRDDLQGPGHDPGPHLPVSHASLALGGELRGADPAARERAGVRGAGDGARRAAAGAADGARARSGRRRSPGPRRTS